MGKFAGYRYFGLKTWQKHRQAAEQSGLSVRGPAVIFLFAHAAGYLQVAAGSCPADTG